MRFPRIPDLPWSRFPNDADYAPARRRQHRLFWVWGGVTFAVVLALAIFIGWPGIQRWSAGRALKRAGQFIELKDYRQAQLLLEQVVQLHPRHFEARRQLADFYARGKSPEALAQWKEVSRLEPENDVNWFGLANAAFQFGDLATARGALAGVSETGKAGADYHRYAAGIALAAGDKQALAEELTDLAALDPANVRLQFNAAALALLSNRPAEAAAARKTMEGLARGDPMRIRATLALLRVSEAKRSDIQVKELAANILPKGRGGLDGLIEHMKTQPNASAVDAGDLGQWLFEHQRVNEAAAWFASLSPEFQMDPVILRLRAACALRLKDWHVLKATLLTGVWGVLPAGMAEAAFDAEERRQQPDEAAEAEALWTQALDRAGHSRGALQVLLRLANEFAWMQEVERTLSRMVEYYPHDTALWEALLAKAEARGDSGDVLEYYDNWAEAMPDNLEVRVREALLSVILNRVETRMRETLNDETLQADPAIIAAKALRNWQTGMKTVARDGLAKLPPASAAKNRRVAIVAAFIWAELGERARSEEFWVLVTSRVGLLPEERKLLETSEVKNKASIATEAPASSAR